MKTERELISKFFIFFEGVWNYVEPIIDVSTYSMGVCDLKLLPNGKFQVTLRRPGLLIGKGGATIGKLEEFLQTKVTIVEKVIERGSTDKK